MRLTAAGLVLERIGTAGADTSVGARLAELVDPDEPAFFPRRSGRRASTTRRHLPSQWHRCARSSTSTASRTKTTG
ncbi:hypothetical protein RN09_0759 [Mycobacterium tuberculosis variant africanum]|nr:hypothetical protein RN09_0759 [Mycobacterium tuberculosis variant africanum]